MVAFLPRSAHPAIGQTRNISSHRALRLAAWPAAEPLPFPICGRPTLSLSAVRVRGRFAVARLLEKYDVSMPGLLPS
jgi:hypothetical protein